MTTRTRSTHVLGLQRQMLELTLTTMQRDDDELRHLDGLVRFSIDTGAATVLTYATPAQARALAASLLHAAADLDALAIQQRQEAA